MSDKPTSDDPAAQIRGLYDRLHEREPEPLALPSNWIDAAVAPGPSVMRPGARVLIAGCGSGHELAGFAKMPGIELVGVDQSAVALAAARARVGPAVRLVEGDLTEISLAADLGSFDLIICNAVADYVPDLPALFATLAACLSDSGALYLGSNTQHHARERLWRVLDRLGVAHGDREGVRAALSLVDAGRSHLPRIADLGQGVIDVDLLVPFAHHLPLASWAQHASQAGLHLFGTLGAPTLVAALGDDELPRLFEQGSAGVSLLLDEVSDSGGRGTLFVRREPLLPPFGDAAALGAWRVAASQLTHVAPLTGDPDVLLPISMPLAGWGSWDAVVPAWVVELARRADGKLTVAALAESTRPRGASLAVPLFRLWMAALITLLPPDGS